MGEMDWEALMETWLPLAIMDISKGRVEGRKRFQKLVFLALVEGKLGDHFHFCNFHYGPYSSDLQNRLDIFEAQGLIVEEQRTISERISPRSDYLLTENGCQLLKNIETTPEFSNYREKLQQRLSDYLDSDTSDLIRFIYSKWLPNNLESFETYANKMKKQVRKNCKLWHEFEEEYNPLAIQVIAGLEQVFEGISKIDKLERLDTTIILNSARDIIRASSDLFSQILKYGCDEYDELPQTTLAAMAEFEESLSYFEKFAGNRKLIIPLDEQIIGDHMSEENQEGFKKDIKEEIRKFG